MARGWNAVEAQTRETEARRQRAQESFLPELRVNMKNPGPFVIRFLEQGDQVHSYYVHEYKEPSATAQGGAFIRRFTCLQEVGMPCPGCSAGLKRKTRGVFNLIQRARPVFRKDKDNRAIKGPDNNYIIDGHADQVVVVNVGGPTAEMLRKADGSYHGLMSRDFQVTFSGDTFQSWNLTPMLDAGGSSNPTMMTENDQALAAQKFDLDAYMRPPTPEEAQSIVHRYGANSGAVNTGGAPMASPQGTAGQAGVTNGFLAGAQVAPGAPPSPAFGAAQQPQAPQAPQAPQPPAAPQQPVAPQGPPQQ